MCNCESEKIEGVKLEAKPNKPTRPICLELADAKTELFKTISYLADKYHLPCFLMEDMFREAWQRVAQLAESERNIALENYENQLKEGAWE
jgi:hypothetical protein